MRASLTCGFSFALFLTQTVAAPGETLHLYWDQGFTIFPASAIVEIDGKRAGFLPINGQLRLNVKPGSRNIRIAIPLTFQRAKMTIDMNGGETRYLSFKEYTDGIGWSPYGAIPIKSVALDEVSPQTAMPVLQRLKTETAEQKAAPKARRENRRQPLR